MKPLFVTLLFISSVLLLPSIQASDNLLPQPGQVAQLSKELRRAMIARLDTYHNHQLAKPADFHLAYIPHQGITISFGELVWKELDNPLEDFIFSQTNNRENQTTRNNEHSDPKLQAYQQLVEKAKANSHQAFAVREQSRKLSEQRKLADDKQKSKLDESLSQLRDQASIAEKQRLEIQTQFKQLDYRPQESVDPEIKSRIIEQQKVSYFQSLVSSVLTIGCHPSLKSFNHTPQESISIIFEHPVIQGAKSNAVVGYTQTLNQIRSCQQSDNPFNWYQSFSY